MGSLHLSYADKLELRKNSLWQDDRLSYEVSVNDYIIDGLDMVHTNRNKFVSCFLWGQLLQNLRDLTPTQITDFFRGAYSWFYYNEKTAYFDAYFVDKLRQSQWLLTKHGTWASPRDITVTELDDSYDKSGVGAHELISRLRFKPDLEEQLVAQMSEEDREKFQITKEILNSGISPEDLRGVLEQIKNQKLSTVVWNPQLPPTGAPINIVPHQPVSNAPVQPNQPPIPKPPSPPPPPKPVIIAPPPVPTNRKEIGKWGEEYVFEALKQEYKEGNNLELTDFGFKVVSRSNENVEVIWLNKESDTGKGYDLIVKVDDKDMRYIEVKTKQSEDPDLVAMSGTQWECAREFGDLYWLYVVSNAGNDESKITPIQNPHKLWGEGKLYAHPVNIKL
jgi:hypothetical protein